MALWGWVAAAYGVFLALTAIVQPLVGRRPIVLAATAAYTLVAAGAATIGSFWIELLAPAVLLLAGYWLSGLFFRDPQAWLEAWLTGTDREFLGRLRLDDCLRGARPWVLEVLEASYTADYVVVGAGALIAASVGVDAVSGYWSIVLAAELACYAALPFLRSRPPRSLEPPGVMAARAPRLRRLNTAILDRASVHANTIPSGHVAGAVAAALAVYSISAFAGIVLMIVALMITAAAVAGRYHYVADCALGAVVAVVAWLLAVSPPTS